MRRPRRDGIRVLLFEQFEGLEFDYRSVVCILIRWYSMKYIHINYKGWGWPPYEIIRTI